MLANKLKIGDTIGVIAPDKALKSKDIDLGIATISGRYPDEGYGVNLISKELIYVIEGSGTLNFENEKIEFSEGDSI